MSFFTLAKSARNLRNRLEIDANFRRGREFIPSQREMLCIETSSICNLECKFCAYPKKQSPKVNMSNEFFFDCIEQAVELGLRHYQLTPCTGDVFMDRRLFSKLDFLEQHAGVSSYEFFTNFTIPVEEDIRRLLDLQKLKHVTLSVYGHDLQSFMAITGAKEKVYRRLITNLEVLLPLLDQRGFHLEIGFRSTRDVPRGTPSDLLTLLQNYRDAGIRVRTSRVYNNWGGMVTQDDVAGLAMDITGGEATYKKGACSLLFTHLQVMATGIVNGCACRDVDATLRIGDLNETPLAEILSLENESYLELIEEQQAGNFRPICESCDFYKSIYHSRSTYRKLGIELQTLKEFMQTAR